MPKTNLLATCSCLSDPSWLSSCEGPACGHADWGRVLWKSHQPFLILKVETHNLYRATNSWNKLIQTLVHFVWTLYELLFKTQAIWHWLQLRIASTADAAQVPWICRSEWFVDVLWFFSFDFLHLPPILLAVHLEVFCSLCPWTCCVSNDVQHSAASTTGLVWHAVLCRETDWCWVQAPAARQRGSSLKAAWLGTGKQKQATCGLQAHFYIILYVVFVGCRFL